MRVPLNPQQCALILQQNPEAAILVQKSPIRCFDDEAYAQAGPQLVETPDAADVLLGVKEVPIDMLVPDKTYLFFSHTIKEQPYNRGLLRAILDRHIRLIDWECLTDRNGRRLIGFGRYAGIVGAYNGFRAFGLREKSYALKAAHLCSDRKEVERELQKVKLPPIKILLSGRGRVGNGALEILHHLNLKEVSVEAFLNENFDGPVFCRVNYTDYYQKKDRKPYTSSDFFERPSDFESNFMRFAQVTDFFIAGHYWDSESPFLFTREDARKKDFKIKVVADISCDIDGPVASTIRPSTIADPIYGYDPATEKETTFDAPGAITVMAVDNLPCELPKDASTDFGNEFIKNILPAFFNGDKDGILQRGTIAEKGQLTSDYTYLQDYVNGK